MKKIIPGIVVTMLLLNTTACGTILYPERKGQISGHIDPGVAVLDGVGLLLFIIPGVIAYAVDFSNGTIYLPGGKKHASVEQGINPDDMIAVHVGKKNLSKEVIQQAIYEKTGKIVDVDEAVVQSVKDTHA